MVRNDKIIFWFVKIYFSIQAISSLGMKTDCGEKLVQCTTFYVVALTRTETLGGIGTVSVIK